jgi:hypothetical protein
MKQDAETTKLDELKAGGYEFTGRNFKVSMGENKGKEFPIYAIKNDISGMVYNNEKDRIELCFKLPVKFSGQPSKMVASLDLIKQPHAM